MKWSALFDSFTNGNHHLVEDGGLINDDNVSLPTPVEESNPIVEQKVFERIFLDLALVNFIAVIVLINFDVELTFFSGKTQFYKSVMSRMLSKVLYLSLRFKTIVTYEVP